VVPLKKSYSSLNLLQSKLGGFSEPKGFFSYLFSNRKYLTVSIPYYDFLRGQIFVEDLHDNFNEEVPAQFSLDSLIFILYDDFLSQIKMGKGNNEEIAHYLLSGMNRHFQITKKEKRVMKSITQNLFQFETIEEEEETEEQQEKERTAYLTIRMRQSEVMRAEVLLHDLEPFLGGTEPTVEQVIAIIYLDFIETVKSKGNSPKVQKSILSYLKSC
jgi:hypothetical protein